MNDKLPEISAELMVIGAGMTGMAASMFAGKENIDVVQVGITGELSFASGLLDLLGAHPMEEGRIRKDPWKAMDELIKEKPNHPYGKISREDMEKAFGSFLSILNKRGLIYHREKEKNIHLITPVGTIKPTYAVPETMINGAFAFRERAKTLIVDFHGLKGFSGRQMVETLKTEWPGLKTVRIPFPDGMNELYPERMALSLELPETREKLAREILPHTDGVDYVALPAILGLYEPGVVFPELQKLLGRKLFEIPTMPPSITGMRLKHIFEQELSGLGVRTFFRHKVFRVDEADNGDFIFHVGDSQPERLVRARATILASGRFIGKGLHAFREKIIETVFDLPVFQPDSREEWHRKSFFDLRGHTINTSGIETDSDFRPIDATGKTIHSNLFAAGSILAHQDWKRMKCGSGLAITTAYAAVEAFKKKLRS